MVFESSHKTYRKHDDLIQQKFIVSRFWRLETQNQDTGKSTLHLKPAGESLPCPF